MKKILGILIGLMLAVPAFASVGVSPTKIEINANKAKGNYVTTTLDIKGDPNSPVRYKLYTGYFTIDEKGEVVMLDKSNDIHDISKKVRFVPSEFTAAPGKTQKVRVNIANINSLPDGESRAILYIEDINTKEYNMPKVGGIGAQLIVKSRIGIPIYVDKGKVTKVGEITELNLTKEKDGTYADFKVASKGNSKIRYNAVLQVVSGRKLVAEQELEPKVVAAGLTYKEKVKLDLSKVEAGEYTVRLVISYNDPDGKRKSIKKETLLNI